VLESCWRNFLTRSGLVQHWTDSAADWHYRVCRQEVGSSGERTVCTRDIQMSVQMATTLSTNCNWWYCVRTAKATFPYWKLLFLSSIFLNSCCSKTAVDFIEICNVCTRKVIIKAARKIFNSDKICRSYCDFYFGVTFFGTHCRYRHLLTLTPWNSTNKHGIRNLTVSCQSYKNIACGRHLAIHTSSFSLCLLSRLCSLVHFNYCSV